MTPREEFADAIEAVIYLWDARGDRLSAFDWRAQIAQLERALRFARVLEAEAAKTAT